MGKIVPEWKCSCGLYNGSRGVKGTPGATARCKGQTCGKSFKESGERRDFSKVSNVWKLNKSVNTTPSRTSTPYSNAASRSETVQNATGASGRTAAPQRSSTVPMHHTSSKTTNQIKLVNQSITQNKNSPGARNAGGWIGWLTRAAEKRE